MSMVVDIDPNSGFCFGVVKAIKKAEDGLVSSNGLVSLGKLVHNNEEVKRLNRKGLNVVNVATYKALSDQTVLFRAHGEPPERYVEAKKNNLTIIDGTCPVVLKLQARIKKAYLEAKTLKGQIVIYGKQGHAEVNGLVGQTENQAIVVQTLEDIKALDKDKKTWLFAQTTQSIEGFNSMAHSIQNYLTAELKVNDTICRQVANRAPKLKAFVKNYDMVLFVSGNDSSNGKYLFGICKAHNANCHFVSSIKDIDVDAIKKHKRFGICGATSTPQWQMEEVASFVKNTLVL